MRPSDRIAVFDNDGTVSIEQPLPAQLDLSSGHRRRPRNPAERSDPISWEPTSPYWVYVADHSPVPQPSLVSSCEAGAGANPAPEQDRARC